MLLSIVIPVFNEEKTVTKILDKISELPPSLNREIIIVDDGSTDGTRKILSEIKSKNIIVILKEKNSGKGDSLAVGFSKSKGDYVIVQDADLEYDPNDYFKLLEEIQKSQNTVVYGSRFMGKFKDMSTTHYFGNKFLTWFTNLLYGVYLTDMETCYKLFPGNFIRGIKINSKRFEFEPEITAKIIKSGLKISEIPISYKGRDFTEGKKISWKDGFSAIISLLRYRFLE
jgi:glycosyltransferase involved in cell wall biosynthesis